MIRNYLSIVVVEQAQTSATTHPTPVAPRNRFSTNIANVFGLVRVKATSVGKKYTPTKSTSNPNVPSSVIRAPQMRSRSKLVLVHFRIGYASRYQIDENQDAPFGEIHLSKDPYGSAETGALQTLRICLCLMRFALFWTPRISTFQLALPSVISS